MPSFQRSEGLQPSNTSKIEQVCPFQISKIHLLFFWYYFSLLCYSSRKTDANSAILDTLPRDPEKLAVTSSLHPFWHTKKGGVVIGLVILTVIGAIVGGAVGGAKAASDNHKYDTVSSSASITSTSLQTTSQGSNGSTLSVTHTVSSTTAGPSAIVRSARDI